MHRLLLTLLFLPTLLILSCQSNKAKEEEQAKHKQDSLASCEKNMPSRFGAVKDSSSFASNKVSHEGMVLIPAGEFPMGASDKEGRDDEYPQHRIKLPSFWIDVTEVTNASFKKFVDATGYKTTAERKPDWEEMKKQLPPGTPKPPDSVFVAASLVFYQPKSITSLNDASQWWSWVKGADWKHPHGPKK
jgi:sulfatase modifying factor 1